MEDFAKVAQKLRVKSEWTNFSLKREFLAVTEDPTSTGLYKVKIVQHILKTSKKISMLLQHKYFNHIFLSQCVCD